ncbi:DUF971 domain-containing protein [Thermithiobacillus plumbiphilus]|uniref:DUF971 domain-containing protein n=1 Tax=Thermithiobacillus plumbiphilus TaxID=1729899 RepID=A0ABU9D3S8_9PROT
MADKRTQPLEIRPLMVSKVMEVDWADGHTSRYTFEQLRVDCPCADCKGHSPDQAKVITGKEGIGITNIEPVGNYAVKLDFEDGHNTGIFSWDYLRRIDPEERQD